MDPDLGVHYETVEDVNLGDTTRVYLSVGLDEESEHSEVLSLTSSTDEVLGTGRKTQLNYVDLQGLPTKDEIVKTIQNFKNMTI